MESSAQTESPVLLIDDDEELGSLLSRFLEKEGFEIISSSMVRAASSAPRAEHLVPNITTASRARQSSWGS